MLNSADDFENLSLLGAIVLRCQVEPQKKFFLSVTTFLGSPTGSGGANEYDLIFYRIATADIDVPHFSSPIESLSFYQTSKLIDRWLENRRGVSANYDQSKMAHYRIGFEVGEINVLAESFECHLVWGVG